MVCVLGVTFILGACAQSPESVEPTPASGKLYQNRPCSELAQDLSGLNHRIAILATEQRSKRVSDTVGWIFILWPTASIHTRDIRPQIALLKGERDAVEQVMAQYCSKGQT
jgi:hypothetical protein